MITTGSPAASLPATRGSDPIFLAPPFGGRQGTRLKISPADFATSLALSIALPVTLFCAAGLDGSAAATLPAPAAGGAGGLAASDLAVSDDVACWAVWVACACTGKTDAGVSSTVAAMASAASDVSRGKRAVTTHLR